MVEFCSVLKEEFWNFLAVREAILSKSAFNHNQCYLASFDTYLSACKLREKVIFEPVVIGWSKTLTGKTSSKANIIIVIRIFIKYLHSLGISAFMPVVPRVADDYIPYIFSDEELKKIFYEADNILMTKSQPNQCIQAEFPMVLRLLYGCGLRIGETLALQMKDIDLDGGVLTLLHTKNCKQRIVPMSPSLMEILQQYCLAMGLIGKFDAYLFPSANPTQPMSIRSARNKFDLILKNTGIALKRRNWHERGPCMHCFRHLFVFRSFAKAEYEGRSIDNSVPFLSIYLGHDSLNETDKYLKFSSELYPQALDIFEDYAGQVFPEVDYEEEVH